MSTPIGLGIPDGPPPTLAPRRKTRQLMVGQVGVGSDHPISVQSMTTTKTHDVNATLQQIAQLTASGCDIVRVACPKTVDAEALPAIAKKSPIPVIADIHFQPKYIFAAIDAGCAAASTRVTSRSLMDASKKWLRLQVMPASRSASALTLVRWISGSWTSTARPLQKHLWSLHFGKPASLKSMATATSPSPSSTMTQSSWWRLIAS